MDIFSVMIFLSFSSDQSSLRSSNFQFFVRFLPNFAIQPSDKLTNIWLTLKAKRFQCGSIQILRGCSMKQKL